MGTHNDKDHELLFGINSITTLLAENAGHRKIYGIYISETRGKDSRIEKIKKLAQEKGVGVSVVGIDDFKDMVPAGENAQNVAAKVSQYNPLELNQFLQNKLNRSSRLVILDQVTDAGNFGSIIRNCRAFGFDGIIIAKRRSAAPGSRVSSISAGALEGMNIIRVPNLAMAIRKLKSKGFWIYGTTLEEGKKVMDLEKTDFSFPMALVMGSEDRGMSRIVTDNCDVLVSINLSGKMQSLNVSVASGIILYHIQEKYKEGRS